MELRTERIEEAVTFATPGGPQRFYRVTFRVGEQGPFTVELKQADFTPERAREEMEKIARTVRSLP